MEEKKERIDQLGVGNLSIIQNKDYFCFGIDSVLLANFAVSRSSKNVVIDLCAGTGVIGILLQAKKKCHHVFSVELQDEMYDLLQRNIIHNHLEEKVTPIQGDIKNVEVIRNRLLEETGNGVADIIVCNPPYKSKGTGCSNPNDVKYMARHEVLCKLEDIFKTASSLLNTKGRLYLVHKPDRLVDLLSLARNYHLEAKTLKLIQPTLTQKPSLVLLEYVKNGGNEMIIEKPLIEFISEGNYSKEIEEMYASGIYSEEKEKPC